MMDVDIFRHEFEQAAAELASLPATAAPGRVERALNRVAAAKAALKLAA